MGWMLIPKVKGYWSGIKAMSLLRFSGLYLGCSIRATKLCRTSGALKMWDPNPSSKDLKLCVQCPAVSTTAKKKQNIKQFNLIYNYFEYLPSELMIDPPQILARNNYLLLMYIYLKYLHMLLGCLSLNDLIETCQGNWVPVAKFPFTTFGWSLNVSSLLGKSFGWIGFSKFCKRKFI